MDKREAQHYDAALKILSGGLGDGMDPTNIKERVEVAIAAAGLLANKVNQMYKQDDENGNQDE